MEAVAVGQALDRGHGLSVVGDGEGEAAVDPAAVEEDCAGAALAVVAALLRAGQAELLAEQVKQGEAGVDEEGAGLAVDAELKLDDDFDGNLGNRLGNGGGAAQKWARQSTQSSHVRGQVGDQSVPM
jgi:hypothetical protein